MIFSITRYKRVEELNIHDYKKFSGDSRLMADVLYALGIFIGLTAVGVVNEI